MNRPPAVPTVQIDNDRVKVTEWRFPPGAETGWHRHAMYYVVVPQTTGALLLETAAGPTTSQLTAGIAYARPVGVEHNVINPGSSEFVFVEIELKSSGRADGASDQRTKGVSVKRRQTLAEPRSSSPP